MSKKKNKKKKSEPADLLVEMKRLRKENEQLRRRLEEIAELASAVEAAHPVEEPSPEHDPAVVLP